MSKKSVYLVRSNEEGCGPMTTQITEDLEEAKATAHAVFAESCDPDQYPGDAAWIEEWALSGSAKDARVVFNVDPSSEAHIAWKRAENRKIRREVPTGGEA